MQTQQPQQQPQRPQRILQPADALAGVVFWGMFFLVSVTMILDDWMRLHKMPTNPMAFLAGIGWFMASINRFVRVRRGEKLRDVMSYPKNASWGWVLLGVLGTLACVAGSVFILLAPPVHRSFLTALEGACLVGLGLIGAGLLGKWTWREYRRRRYGESVVQLETFQTSPHDEQMDLRMSGVGALGMALGGLFLLVLGILGARTPGSSTIGIAIAVFGGLFALSGIVIFVEQQKKKQAGDKP
jgi:hypothetical protein